MALRRLASQQIPPSLRFAPSCTISWIFLRGIWSLGRYSSPGDFPSILYCLVLSALIWTGFFHHPLRRNVVSIAVRLLGAPLASPVLQGCLFSGASLARLLYFRLSEQIGKLDVLSKSHLLLFDSHIFPNLSLLSVGGGGEIIV